ncbi:MAG: hypothetical protein ACFFAH_05530 [Promethearchaeota archaeon]
MRNDYKKKLEYKNYDGMMIIVRYCANCKKQYNFYDVKENYPDLCYNELKELWQDHNIKFYCSYCYLIKLIKYLKSKD